ncbi:ATP-dependent DNA ligase [Streptomyces sp. NPDC001635]
MVEYPARLALAQPVTSPPTGTGWWAEPKFDGHRVCIWRLADAVRLHTRAGRDVTSQWMDLAVPAMQLRPATVLDGEAVVYVGGRVDFSAAQARNASRPARARVLAQYSPASYAAFDVLQHPDYGDVRHLPYLRRRELLLELLEDLGPPLQAVPATDDRGVADLWYEALRPQGVEGLVWKHESSPYRGNHRIWRKQRHADTLDGTVVGYTGPPARPHHLAVRLPDGRVAMSQRLTSVLATQIGERLAGSSTAMRGRTLEGEVYSVLVEAGPVVEVLAGSTRHGVLTVVRTR